MCLYLDVCEEVELEDAEVKVLLLADEEQLAGIIKPARPRQDATRRLSSGKTLGQPVTYFVQNNFA